jgi:importin-9
MDEEHQRQVQCSRVLLDSYNVSLLDPIFVSIIGNILETLASCPTSGVYQVVVKKALPLLCQALGSVKFDDSWIPSSALELLNGIIEGADGEKGLGDGFFSSIAPPLFKCMGSAEDRDVLQVCQLFPA